MRNGSVPMIASGISTGQRTNTQARARTMTAPTTIATAAFASS